MLGSGGMVQKSFVNQPTFARKCWRLQENPATYGGLVVDGELEGGDLDFVISITSSSVCSSNSSFAIPSTVSPFFFSTTPSNSEKAFSRAAFVYCEHGVLTGLLQDRQAAADGAQGGGVGDAEQVAQALLGRVVPQPDHRQQELVGHRQIEAVAAADGPPPSGPVQAPAAVGGDGGEQVGQELVEGRDRQAGHGPEDGRVLAEVF